MIVPFRFPALSLVSEVVTELHEVDIRLADMSKQVSEMQTYFRRWTTSAPRDRYEKRVGSANKFFGPMEWDDIIAFAQTSQQDWVIDPWNFYCMLEHLAHAFPAKMESCGRLNHRLYLAAQKLRQLIAGGFPDDQVDEFLDKLEEQTRRFLELISQLEGDVVVQLRRTAEVTRELERIGIWRY